MITPTSVKEGVRDFIVHRTGTLPEKVEIRTEMAGYVVEVRTEEPLPVDVEEQIRLMLPQDYILEIEE